MIKRGQMTQKPARTGSECVGDSLFASFRTGIGCSPPLWMPGRLPFVGHLPGLVNHFFKKFLIEIRVERL